MSRLSPSRLVDAVGESLDAGVLVEDAGRPRQVFAHELVQRDALRRPCRRGAAPSSICRSAPSSRSSTGATPTAASPRSPTTSRSPARSATREKTIGYLDRAAERAATLLAYEEAARHYGRGRSSCSSDGRGLRPAALRPAPAPRRRPVAGGRRRSGALELRGGDGGRAPARGGRAARARGARLRDRARRLPPLRAVRGRSDRRRSARRGARRASRGRQPAPGDPALAARGRAVLGERADRAPRSGERRGGRGRAPDRRPERARDGVPRPALGADGARAGPRAARAHRGDARRGGAASPTGRWSSWRTTRASTASSSSATARRSTARSRRWPRSPS